MHIINELSLTKASNTLSSLNCFLIVKLRRNIVFFIKMKRKLIFFIKEPFKSQEINKGQYVVFLLTINSSKSLLILSFSSLYAFKCIKILLKFYISIY